MEGAALSVRIPEKDFDEAAPQERLRDDGHHRELPRLRLNPSQKQGCQNLSPVRVTVFTRPSVVFHPSECGFSPARVRLFTRPSDRCCPAVPSRQSP